MTAESIAYFEAISHNLCQERPDKACPNEIGMCFAVKSVLTAHQRNASLSVHLPFQITRTIPCLDPTSLLRVEHACSGFCYFKFQFPDQGKSGNAAWWQQLRITWRLLGCGYAPAPEMGSGLTQHRNKRLCFWLVLSSCHFLLHGQDSPANHRLPKTQNFEQSLSVRSPGKHPNIHTHISEPFAKPNRKTWPKRSQMFTSSWLSLGEHRHFPDTMTETMNIKAFQEVIMKLRYISSQFCSEPFLQSSRAPVNVIPNIYFGEDAFHNLLDQKDSYWHQSFHSKPCFGKVISQAFCQGKHISEY